MVKAVRPSWGLASLALALAAIASHLPAKRHAALAMTGLARATAEGADERTRQAARWHARLADLWGWAGLAALALAIACCLVAGSAGRRSPRLAIAVLVVAFFLLSMIVV